MVKANVDKILDVLNQKNSVSTGELSKTLNLKKEDIEKSAEFLEQDGVIKIEHKFPHTMLTLLKKQTQNIPPLQEQQSQGLPPPPPVGGKPKIILPDKKPAQQSQTSLQSPTNLPQPIQPEQKLLQSPMEDINLPQSTSTIETSHPPIQPMPEIEPLELQPHPSDIPKSSPFPEPQKIVDEDPLNPHSPGFDLPVPDPVGNRKKPNLAYTNEFSANQEIKFPDYIKTGVEKIEFLLGELRAKINNHDYKDLNIEYRKVFNVFQEADLTTNESYLMKEKIQEVYDTIKNIYMIEQPL